MNSASDLNLNAAHIAALLNKLGCDVPVEVVATTGSTNADLRARLAGLSQPLLLAAQEQTAGRGRAGRSWLAAAENSLCFSLAWRFSGPVTHLLGLPLAVGVVLAETLNAQGWPVRLKWPNDLLKEGHKLGGILIETAAVREQQGAQTSVWAVIGVGINIHQNPSMQQAVGHAIAALASEPVERNALLASLAAALAVALPQFDLDGLAPFLARWQALHAYAGQAVQILEAGQQRHRGIAVGIDERGCLLLDTENGRLAIAAGDVSLRSVAGEGNHAAVN